MPKGQLMQATLLPRVKTPRLQTSRAREALLDPRKEAYRTVMLAAVVATITKVCTGKGPRGWRAEG